MVTEVTYGSFGSMRITNDFHHSDLITFQETIREKAINIAAESIAKEIVEGFVKNGVISAIVEDPTMEEKIRGSGNYSTRYGSF